MMTTWLFVSGLVYTFQLISAHNSNYQGINFDNLNTLLDNIIEETNNKSNEIFIDVLNNEWSEYENRVKEYASLILSYGVQKNVMVDLWQYNVFIKSNEHKLKQLLLKYDENVYVTNKLAQTFQNQLHYNPMKEYNLYSLFHKISNLYQTNTTNTTVNDKLMFRRKSFKFFVKSEDLSKIITEIIQRLPIYIYDQENGMSEQLNSIYFDNNDLKCYHSRVLKEEGSRIIRVRWYGKSIFNNNTDLYIERKLHHKQTQSVKQRFGVKYHQIIPFFNGKKIFQNIDNGFSAFQTEIVSMFDEYKLKPITRTVYERMSFQLNDLNCNDIRITLDTNLTMVKENGNINIDEWNEISKRQTKTFPFSILELKLSGNNVESPPLWITKFMNSSLLLSSKHFSKYGQSVNVFYGNKVNIVPKWIDEYSLYFNDTINSYGNLTGSYK